jgi:hypothetical protein
MFSVSGTTCVSQHEPIWYNVQVRGRAKVGRTNARGWAAGGTGAVDEVSRQVRSGGILGVREHVVRQGLQPLRAGVGQKRRRRVPQLAEERPGQGVHIQHDAAARSCDHRHDAGLLGAVEQSMQTLN